MGEEKLTLTGPAQADLDRIFDYVALDNPKAARDFTAGLVRRCRLIGSNPFIGRRRSELGFDIRVFTFRGYRICYEVVEDRVDIIRIIEPKRDIEGQFE